MKSQVTRITAATLLSVGNGDIVLADLAPTAAQQIKASHAKFHHVMPGLNTNDNDTSSEQPDEPMRQTELLGES